MRLTVMTFTFYFCIFCVAGFAQESNKLYFGVTSVALTKNTKNIFDLVDILSIQTGMQIEPKFAKNYDEIKLMLDTKEVDFAYVCGATYVEAKQSASLEILAFPYFEDSPHYYSLTIARADDDSIKSILDFQGKNYAFSDPKSNSGSLVPMCRLKTFGYNYRVFFGNLIYTYDHSYSIEAVIDGYVDGASIDSLIYESYMLLNPHLKNKIKIVDKLGPFQTTPIVIRKEIKQSTKQKLFQALNSLHLSPQGEQVLKHFGIGKFDYTDNYDYSDIEKRVKCADK
jgi:phosphonate transport system substrate-binding protein